MENVNKVDLSIIIVNYNGQFFLENCLNSIKDNVECSYEIIIVDNNSIDKSCELIKSKFPTVKLIESKVNTGFTGGNNLGASFANGQFLLLLNNDTVIEEPIGLLLKEFTNAKVGVVGTKLIYGDGRQQFSVGYEHSPFRVLMSWLGCSRFKLTENMESFYTTKHEDVNWLSGAFLLTPRELWNKLDGLDESYFMYVEDVDYCKRVRLAGYRVVYLPTSLITHFEGGGKEWIGEKALVRTVKSYQIYFKKFYGSLVSSIARILLSFVFFLRSFGYSVLSIFKPSSVLFEKRKAYFNAAISFLKGI